MLNWVLLFGACPKEMPRSERLTLRLDETLPVDPGVTMGTLNNGLRYFVEENHLPEDRVVLRLVVNAGSALEDDDQRGIAHLLEHMAFNGTEHFAGNEMVRVIEGLGARFGPHLNAHTSFDETVYKLTVPSDPASVEIGLQVLADWAGGMTLSTEEIEAERGVVLEEWRTRQGAGDRIFDRTLPVTWFGSKYADRQPIGTEESLRTFTPDAVRRFYADWYRPGLMAVAIVGDVDPAAMAAEIERRFSGLAGPTSPRERVAFPVPSHQDTKVVVVADPEIARASVSLQAKFDDPEGLTRGTYRDDLVAGLALHIVNERLAALAEGDDPPFLAAGVGRARLAPSEAAWTLGARTKEENILVGFEAALVEVERVRRHGVVVAELDRARSVTVAQYEKMLLEQETTESVSHIDELVRVYLHGESMPGTEAEVALARELLPGITVNDLGRWFAQWMAPTSRMIYVTMPQRIGLEVPSEQSLLDLELRVALREVEPLREETPIPPLLDQEPVPGTVVSSESGPLGFTRLELSNGATLYYRRTNYKAAEVLWTATSPGGLLMVSDADYTSAATANQIAHRSGFGNLNATEYKRWLAGKDLSIWHTLTSDNDRFGGSSTPADLSAALSVWWASVTAPRMTVEGAKLVREEQLAAVRNRAADPNAVFDEAWAALLWPDSPRWRPWTLAQVEGVDLGAATRTLTDRYGDSSDAVFVFSGALPDDFETLAAKFVGGLPGGSRSETPPPDPTRLPTGAVEQVLYKGLEPKARVRWMYHTPIEASLVGTTALWEERAVQSALETVLRTRLREELRERLSGVYGVGASVSARTQPDQRTLITIDFTCDPGRVAELEAAMAAVLVELKAAPPAERYLKQHVEQVRLSRTEDEQTNDFWRDALVGAIEREEDPALVDAWEDRLNRVTGARIQDAAARYFGENHFRLVMLPEAK